MQMGNLIYRQNPLLLAHLVDSIHEHHSHTNDTTLKHVQGDHSPDTFKFRDISRLFTTFLPKLHYRH